MLDAADKATAFVTEMDYEAFARDDRTHFAVVRALEVVEVVEQISISASMIPKSPAALQGWTWNEQTSHNVYASETAVSTEPRDNSMLRAYEEIIDFIAAGTSPSHVADFQPSQEAKARVAELIRREKTVGLSDDEAAELGHYLQLEHLMRLAKARARHHLLHE